MGGPDGGGLQSKETLAQGIWQRKDFVPSSRRTLALTAKGTWARRHSQEPGADQTLDIRRLVQDLTPNRKREEARCHVVTMTNTWRPQ